jgi:hypothetical protein
MEESFDAGPTVNGECLSQRRGLQTDHEEIARSLRTADEEIEYYNTTAHILFHYNELVESGAQGGSVASQDPGGGGHHKVRTCFEEGTLRSTDDKCRQSSILEFMTKSTSGGCGKPFRDRPDLDSDAGRGPGTDEFAVKTGGVRGAVPGTADHFGNGGDPGAGGSKLTGMSRAELADRFAKSLAIFDSVPERAREKTEELQGKRGSVAGARGAANGGYGRCVPRPPTLAGKSCPHCGSAGRSLVANEGYLVCPECDAVEFVMIESERPSYREAPREISYFCYKRQNHFQEWISQTQGREYTNIPESVFDMILVELKKQKVTNVATLTPKKLKDIMRKLGLNKYYEHLQFLLNHLSGAPLARIPPELEAQLRRMFQQIQVPFMRHAPANRRNFLSYSFCLHKMLQLLEHDDLLQHFPLLKSREKLHQQDLIWKAICEDLGWQWIRSA